MTELETKEGYGKDAYVLPFRRTKVFSFSAEVLFRLFMHRNAKAYLVIEGIPDGARYRNIRYNFETDKIDILVEHPSFPEVYEGEKSPTAPIVTVEAGYYFGD